MIGNIEPAALYYSSDVTYAVPRSAGSRSLAFEAAPGPKAVEVTLLPGGPPGVLDFPALDPLRTLPPPVALNTVVGLLGGPGVPVPATYPNLQAPLYRFAEGAVQVPGPAPQRLTVTSGGDAYLVTLPFPWHSPHGDAAVVEMLVNLRQGPTGSPISVAVRDQLLGAGLAYMSTGALGCAAADVRRRPRHAVRQGGEPARRRSGRVRPHRHGQSGATAEMGSVAGEPEAVVSPTSPTGRSCWGLAGS